MPNCLCLTVQFLQPYCHGRSDGGEPEWPPSPLRLFQALIAASAARWNERQRLDYSVPALMWLESQPVPMVIAVDGVAADTPYRLYVPDNVGNKLGKSWSGGREANIADYRAEKDVRPTNLSGEAIHYLYTLPPEGCPHLDILRAAARSMTHLGWGIDMVAADARVISQDEADKLPGHRWCVVPSGGVSLRVPKPGTLADLMRKHEGFLRRLSDDGFKPVPPLSCFDVMQYYSQTVGNTSQLDRPMAAFEIHRTIDDQEAHPGKSRFRPFHHVRRVASVAGMVRHTVAAVARQMGHSEAWVNEHVLGHGDGKSGQATTRQRLWYLPLPSITPVGVRGIRRVLIVGWPGCGEIAGLRRRLNGGELIDQDQGKAVAMLSHLASSDREVMKYVQPSRVWSTVTPVILPGYDDPTGLRRKLRRREGRQAGEQRHLLERLDQRIVGLIWKAFEQAGWTSDALVGAELEYRGVGWFAGLEPATAYQLPPITYPKYHVRVTFPREVRGPLAIGAGRYRGFGLFVPAK